MDREGPCWCYLWVYRSRLLVIYASGYRYDICGFIVDYCRSYDW